MRNTLFIICFLPLSLYGQNNIDELRNKKAQVKTVLLELNDSLKVLDGLIQKCKVDSIKEIYREVGVIGLARANSKLKLDNGREKHFRVETEVQLLEYKYGKFLACADGRCGKISMIYIKSTPEVEALIELGQVRMAEEKAQNNIKKDSIKAIKAVEDSIRAIEDSIRYAEKLAKDSELYRRERAERAKAQAEEDEIYTRVWGASTYAKIKEGKVWIGMTDDMARVSWGNPKSVNRTINAYGTKEQWVYSSSYLYFDDGILTSIQTRN